VGNFWKALKAGAKATAESLGPGQYIVQDKQVSCSHCSNNTFTEGSAQLNTAGMSFIGFDWANKSATTLLCSECGRIEWYINKPKRV
jgi:predicted nucleic-acid-binding Zn-ribbon protein